MKSCWALTSAQSWFSDADRVKFRAKLAPNMPFEVYPADSKASITICWPASGGSYFGMLCSNFNEAPSCLPSSGCRPKGRLASDKKAILSLKTISNFSLCFFVEIYSGFSNASYKSIDLLLILRTFQENSTFSGSVSWPGMTFSYMGGDYFSSCASLRPTLVKISRSSTSFMSSEKPIVTRPVSRTSKLVT